MMTENYMDDFQKQVSVQVQRQKHQLFLARQFTGFLMPFYVSVFMHPFSMGLKVIWISASGY